MDVTLTIPKKATMTASDFKRAMEDPVYFIDTFCHTFDPRPEAYPHHLPFKLYPFQKDYVLWLVDHIREGKDCLTDKSRDMGASWLVLDVFLWFWMFEPGFQALLGSRKEDLVDNGTLDSLFGKLDYTLDRLPFAPEGFDPKKHRTYMKIVNPMNGNVMKGESANAEFSRQGRYRAALLDEGGFWDNLETAWTAAGDATPARVLVTTPPRKPTFAKYLRFSGKTDFTVLNWRDHPKKDAAWYEAQCARRTPEEIAQELDNNWEGSITGRVYPEISHVRIGDFPYRPDWPLYWSHDPGHDPDPHAVGIYQVDPSTGRKRLVESMVAYKKLASWFLPFFGEPIDSTFSYTPEELALVEKVGPWKRGIHFGDVYGRTGNQVTGTSVYEEWAHSGIIVQSNTDAIQLEPRKKAARKVLMELDVNDTPNNRYWMECIQNSRYPDLGESSSRVTSNDKPIHDWTSHHRSELEYFAVNLNWRPDREEDRLDGTFKSALARIQSTTRPSDVIN